MPGRSPSAGAWGDLALLIDTSAFARAQHPQVREQWWQALNADRLRIAPATQLEILLGARSGKIFDELAEELSMLRPAPLTATVARAAQDAMRTFAHRSDGAQRIPIVDYFTAAAAQETGAAVLHYDHDYETLAEVIEFESVWLAPPGLMP